MPAAAHSEAKLLLEVRTEAPGPWPVGVPHRLVGRGLSALELGLCAAVLCLLLGAALPRAGDPSDAETGAGRLGLGWVRYRIRGGSRRLADDVEPDFDLIADEDSTEAATTVHSTTTTTVVTTMNAMKMQGGKENSKADDNSTLEAVFVYWGCMAPLYVIVFLIFRRLFPVMMTFYTTSWARTMRVPIDLRPETMFEWVRLLATISRREDLWKIIGLDEAMMLEFPELCLRISLYVGVPMVLITCPINYFSNPGADDQPFLNKLGLFNLGQGNSPLVWVHAVIVWIVVVIVCWLISDAEAKFVAMRYEWLKSLREPRATTLMVENIPKEYQSDVKLREIFSETLCPDAVVSAHTVKDTRELNKLVAKIESMALQRKKAFFKSRTDGTENRELLCASGLEAELDEKILAERRRVLQKAEQPGGVNTSTGFVTFDSQSSVAAAYSARITQRVDEFVMTVPPNPDHVNYRLLSKDLNNNEFLKFLGYVCIYLVFFLYTSTVTAIVTFGEWLENVDRLGWLKPAMHNLLPTLAFQLCIGYLPTILRLIFESFWACPSEPYVQKQLYRWYFWFLYVFVLFISVIGGNPIEKAKELSEEPFTIPSKIAEALPKVSNWFVALVVLQASSHVLSLTRYIEVIKYTVLRTMYSMKDAKVMAEPEDQDFFGIGSRSARWINTMLIGLVFCQIQPTLLFFTAINFISCKIVYGYLLVFAQSRKDDRGGVIFQAQLKHLQVGLATYIIVMTGWLADHEPPFTFEASWRQFWEKTTVPVIGNLPPRAWQISFASIIYLMRCSYKLANIDCSVLPRRLVPKRAQPDKHDDTVSYIQPELLEKKFNTDYDGDGHDDDWLAEASLSLMSFGRVASMEAESASPGHGSVS